MAIDNANVIDGIGIDDKRNAICLLLTDHLDWAGSDGNALSEYDHLMLLQDKINAYASYIGSKQYERQYPGASFDMAVIEIHFKHDVTENCERFLNSVQAQLGQHGIRIEAHVG